MCAHLLPAPKRFAALLALVVVGLTAAHIGTQYLKFFHRHNVQMGLVRLFDLEGEGNIPSWYAASTLLVCAALLRHIALARRRACDPYARHWMGLAGIFLYLSLDEGAAVHELTARPLASVLALPLWLSAGWVVAGVGFALIVWLVCRRFLAALPAATRRLFLVAGGIYLAGALGVEIFATTHLYTRGADFVYKVFMVASEEFLEMAGIVVFLYALASYAPPGNEGTAEKGHYVDLPS